LEQGIALYDSRNHRSLAFLYGFDPGVFCQTFVAWTLWFLGYPDQALDRIQRMLTLAQEVTHPWSLNWALAHSSWFYQFRREGREVQKQAEAALALASEYGFPYWAAEGYILRGWAMVEREQAEEGITQIRQGLTAYRDIEAELAQTYFLALLVEAYGEMGEVEKGFRVLTEALATVDKTGERYYEAELYRLKGHLTLQSKVSSAKSRVEEAEGCFWKAIEIARRQQARLLELRAATSH
jgi:predicted ATPase